jgi:rifampicin phosphotransferase
MKKSIYVFSANEALPDVRLVGGKARNLALLNSSGLPVPGWLSVTTVFFERFLKDSIKKIDTLLKGCTKKNINTVTEKICSLINNAEFSSAQKKAILDGLSQAFGNGRPEYFSVRSSAVDEDSSRFSFAGQLESFLYVRPDETLFESIRKCFASAYSSRVMTYRMSQGLPLTGVRPAVIIQEMIFGEISGVMFTGNPLNNDTDQILINSTYGIGEGIVSGELDADSWVVDEDDCIISEQIAKKTDMITFDNDRGFGTIKKVVPPELTETASLTSSQIAVVASLGRRIESVFGNVPQDIEWCMKEDRIYILQSRPVTTMSHIDKSKPRTVLDNSNIIESFPGVTSPLTFSFASANYEMVYRQFFRMFGVPQSRINRFAEIFRTLLCYIDGRIYYNLNSWHRALKLLPGYNINSEYMDKMMGVKQASRFSEKESITKARKILIEIPVLVYSISKVLLNFKRIDKISQKFIDDFYAATTPYMDEKFENYNNLDLLKLYDFFQDNVLENWKAPIVNDFYTMVYFGTLGKMVAKLDIPDAKSVQNDLLCGQGEIESTKPTREIIRMSNWIRTVPGLAAMFRDMTEDELIKLILKSTGKEYEEIRSRLKKYISEYGFRCMFELKLEEPSLKEDPRFLFTALKNYLKKEAVDLDKMEANEKEIKSAAEKKVFARLSPVKKMIFSYVLNTARKAIKNREELRFMRTKIFGICRSMFNRMGVNLCEHGIIEDRKDIYFLHLDEIRQLIEGRSTIEGIVKNVISLRKHEFRDQQSKDSPERMYFFGEMQDRCFVEILTENDMEFEEDESGRSFKGVPCSPGEVTAKAKIVLSPHDANLNGEIMVAKRTDPGWVPLFPSVSGIIIERGSVLSHSAVVAREMGIPTIVGLRGITKKIENGETVHMNGNTGIVQRI